MNGAKLDQQMRVFEILLFGGIAVLSFWAYFLSLNLVWVIVASVNLVESIFTLARYWLKWLELKVT